MLSAAAMELSKPTEESSFNVKKGDRAGHVTDRGGRSLLRKPWEEIIRERVKAKTRLISKVTVFSY